MALFPSGTFPFPLFHQKSKRKEILEAYALLPICIELFFFFTLLAVTSYMMWTTYILSDQYIYIYIYGFISSFWW